MNVKKILSAALALLLLAGVLTGCGASVSKNEAQDFSPGEPMAEEMTGNSLAAPGDTAATVPEGRKWIATVRVSAETEDLDAVTAALKEEIASLGGYVEDQHIRNGSPRSARRYRSASLTVRIPADRVDSFTGTLAGLANVVTQDKTLEDVTLRYVSTESRRNALEAEEARLLELMAQAEDMSDLLEIESRLTDVRYELENAVSQLRLYDNRIDYATVYLDIEEVQEFTPVKEPTVWERIRDGFLGSLKGLGSGILDLLIWIIVSSPYLLVLGGLAFLITRRIKKRRKQKQEKQA